MPGFVYPRISDKFGSIRKELDYNTIFITGKYWKIVCDLVKC